MKRSFNFVVWFALLISGMHVTNKINTNGRIQFVEVSKFLKRNRMLISEMGTTAENLTSLS